MKTPHTVTKTNPTKKGKHDIVENRWERQQAKEDMLERSWSQRQELARLADLFFVSF